MSIKNLGVNCKLLINIWWLQELPGLKVSSNSKNFHSIPGCILGMGERRVKASMMVIWHGSKNAQIVSAAEIYTHFPEMIKAYHDRIDQEKNGGVLRWNFSFVAVFAFCNAFIFFIFVLYLICCVINIPLLPFKGAYIVFPLLFTLRFLDLPFYNSYPLN